MPAQRQMGGRGASGRPAATGKALAPRGKRAHLTSKIKQYREISRDTLDFSKKESRKGWQMVNAGSSVSSPKKARTVLKAKKIQNSEYAKNQKRIPFGQSNNFGKKTTKGTKPLRRRGPR